jgi:hypothetical protein
MPNRLLLKILFVFFFLEANLFAQISNSPDSLAEKTSEVKSIQKEVAKYPLQPVETSSPRTTLQNFLENVYRAHRILILANAENQQTSVFFYTRLNRAKSEGS